MADVIPPCLPMKTFIGKQSTHHKTHHPAKRRAAGCRWHLSESQRGMVAAKLANLENGQRATSANLQSLAVTQSDAADMLNVSPRTVATAARRARPLRRVRRFRGRHEKSAYIRRYIGSQKD